MKKKVKENNVIAKQNPQVFLKKIMFNDGNQLEINKNSIIVFTGANNSGKSQVLKDVENFLDEFYNKTNIVIRNMEYAYCGDIDEQTFFNEHFYMNDNGYYQSYYSSILLTKNEINECWKNHKLKNALHLLFVKRLKTELRLTSSNALDLINDSKNHPIYKLINNEKLAQRVSDYFHQAFGVDLIVNRNEIKTIPLHTGKAPDKKEYKMDEQDKYYNQVAKLPKLQDQGDGMRSFASILLEILTSEHNMILVDEPESFLHPPQARIMGKMLVKQNLGNRQLLISTHSEDFLQGLLDADNENVIVIRIDRIEQVNNMSILKNTEIKKLWSNPLLRYSNILSGLFHEKVIVCESDYDCLFYQAIMNAISEQDNEIAPDFLFTHCGGKTRVDIVIDALRAVNVPVVSICDFDLLNDSRNFKKIVKSFGINWKTGLDKDMMIIYDSINAKNSNGNNFWEYIKKNGKHGIFGNEFIAYEKVETLCKSAGLFVVPFGEMECFDKTTNKEKKEWVYNVLEKYNLAIEPKFEAARKFIKEIIDFKPITKAEKN